MIVATSALAAFLALGSVSAGHKSALHQPLSPRRVEHDKKVATTAHTLDQYFTRRRAGKESKAVIVNHKDLVFESDAGTLRGLSQKNPDSRDNFLLLSDCGVDPLCASVESQWAILVNYCFNWGEQGIFMIKMNRKDNTAVSLDYEDEKCNGVPIRVTDVMKTYFGESLPNDYVWGSPFMSTADAGYMSVSYLSSRPMPPTDTSGVLFAYAATNSMCMSNKYREYGWSKAASCNSYGDSSSVYYCNIDGSFTEFYYYNSADCTGDFDDFTYSELCEYDSFYDEYVTTKCTGSLLPAVA